MSKPDLKQTLLTAMQQSVQQTEVKISTGQKIRVRAFLMKEMKMLMLANESNSSIEDTIVQIVNNCILTEGVRIELLPIYDIETLYLALFKLSKGTPLIPASFTCQNEIETDPETGRVIKRCGNTIKVNINLNTAKLTNTPNNEVVVNEHITVIMRYPNITELEYFNIQKESDLFNLILRCVHKVRMGDEVYEVGKDVPYEDLIEIMEYASEEAISKLSEFVSNIPQHEINIPLKCKGCGHEEIVTLTGVHSFFA